MFSDKLQFSDKSPINRRFPNFADIIGEPLKLKKLEWTISAVLPR